MRSNGQYKIEYGDFQTPPDLTYEICQFLYQSGIKPNSIVEPTCGEGNFLISAMECFPSLEIGLGSDINSEYIEQTKSKLCGKIYTDRVKLIHSDFFRLNWKKITSSLPEPILFIGNPPWVTNSSLGSFKSKNFPQKTNFHQRNGLDALTGKSNFDISESILRCILDSLSQKSGWIALLCKTIVARKIIQYTSQNKLPIIQSNLYIIDAKKNFHTSVDAGLLVCELGTGKMSYDCSVYEKNYSQTYHSNFGIREGELIANLELFNQWKHLQGREYYQWRSGLKHDCSKVMELYGQFPYFKNGFGQPVEIESDYVFPLLKSSDLANMKKQNQIRSVIVTQRKIGDNTQSIQSNAPLTWKYLSQYQEVFNQRKSKIYKGKPPFSMFGIGDYSFSPWKVGISDLYKQLSFCAIAPKEGKPVMLDDTCYFIPCNSKEEAHLLEYLLNSLVAQEFFTSFIFWDSKRPITASLLNRLNLFKLADILDKEKELKTYQN